MNQGMHFGPYHFAFFVSLALLIGCLVGRAWNGWELRTTKRKNVRLAAELGAAVRLMARRGGEAEVRLAS